MAQFLQTRRETQSGEKRDHVADTGRTAATIDEEERKIRERGKKEKCGVRSMRGSKKACKQREQ